MRLGLVVLTLVVGAACAPEPRVFRDDLVTAPDVVGARVSEAGQRLRDGGFLVRVVAPGSDTDIDCPDGRVLEQDPAGGSDVLKATTVTLTAVDCAATAQGG